MNTTRRAEELAAVLSRRQEAIQSSWTALVLQRPGDHYETRSAEELTAWTARNLEAIIESLATGSSEPLEAHAARISTVRARLGFEIQEVVRGLLLLKEVAFGEITDAYPDDPDHGRDATLRFDQSLHALVACFAADFAELMRRSVRRERDRIGLLLKTAEAAGSSLDLGLVLSVVADSLKQALKASHCSIHSWDEANEAFSPQASAGQIEDEALRAAVERLLTPEVDPLIVQALSTRDPVLRHCSGENHLLAADLRDACEVAAVVALPIRLADRVLALAVALLEEPLGSLSEDQIELARGIASTVAPAVDNARQYSEAREQVAESQRLEQATSSFLGVHGLQEGLELICREIRDLTRAGGATIYLPDGDGELRCAYTSGTAVAEGPKQAQLALPLRHKEHDLGKILLTDLPRGVDPDAARILQRFADRAATTIEHASYHEQKEELAALEERHKLAHELHDSVTQSLYGVTMFAEAAARLEEAGDHSKAERLLRQLRDTSLEALRQMRLLLFDLRPPVFAEQGLVEALQTRLSAVEERAGFQAQLTAEGVGSLPPELAEGLYGICTEALNNSLKHAGASRISVHLREIGPTVRLEVVDDGQGFDPAQARNAGGMGLAGMEERAARLGAKLSVTSRLGEGTRVRVIAPLEVPPDQQRKLQGGAR